MWMRANLEQSDVQNRVHVYPLFGREHNLDGDECWCHPEPDLYYENVVVHNVEN